MYSTVTNRVRCMKKQTHWRQREPPEIVPSRNRILLEQRQRIIQAFEDVNEDYLTVAATIGVNRSTARSIVARYLREGRIAERSRGGANHIRVKFPHNPILHYAFSSWIEKTMTKTIDCHQENRFVLQQYGAVRKLYQKESTMPTDSCAMLQ